MQNSSVCTHGARSDQGWGVLYRGSGILAAALVLIASGLVSGGITARAQDGKIYTLDSGDVILVTVYGLPEYPVEIQVDDAGIVSLPVIGDIQARGKSRADVRAEIAASLERTLMNNPRVQVSIKQYRPFYVGGHVSRPGSYPYQPNITVRHAIAIAGGIGVGGLNAAGMTAVTVSELQARRARLDVEIFRYQVRMARLEAEIAESNFAPPDLTSNQLAPELVDRIIAAERQQYELRKRNRNADRAHLADAIGRAVADLELMKMALAERESIREIEARAFEVLRKLEAKNLTKGSQVLEAEQEFRSATEQLHDLRIQLSTSEQNIVELRRAADKEREERTALLLTEVRGLEATLEGLNGERMLVREKMSLWADGGGLANDDKAVSATITRKAALEIQVHEAELDANVQAGDMVHISIQREDASTDYPDPTRRPSGTPQAGFFGGGPALSQ